MAGIEANEWCYAVCFAVFIKRISIMGSVQQELFNMKPRKVGFHGEKRMQEREHIMPGSALKHGENGKVVFRTGSNKHVEMVTEKIFVSGGIPSPVTPQAVKTSVCSHSQSLLGSRRSFWSVQALRFQEESRCWQVKGGMDLSVPCGRIHQGTGLYTAKI